MQDVMRYYRGPFGAVYAYDPLQVEAGLAEDKTELSPEELNAHLQPPVAPLSREDVEALRLRAYADPVNGSDRRFAEAARMQAMGEPGWEVVREVGVTRYQAIQEEYPWP